MARENRAQVKDDDTYEALRRQGESKEKAARIANARTRAGQGKQQEPSKKGGRSGRYEDWSKDDLYERAKEIGIEGRSKMDKGALIDALRNH